MHGSQISCVLIREAAKVMISIYFPFMSEDSVLGIGVILEPVSPCIFIFTYKRPLSKVDSLMITGVEIRSFSSQNGGTSPIPKPFNLGQISPSLK